VYCFLQLLDLLHSEDITRKDGVKGKEAGGQEESLEQGRDRQNGQITRGQYTFGLRGEALEREFEEGCYKTGK